MFGGGCGGPPMNMMPMIPALPPKKRAPPPCEDDDGSTKITAQIAAPFLEELTKLGECKELNAEVNGKVYNIKLCSKSKKKKRSSSSGSESDGDDRKSSGSSKKGPNVKLCDCNLPLPPGLAGKEEPDRKSIEKEERMNKNLALCMKMMRELFIKNYDKQQEEDENAVRMVEIPVMVVPPGGMPGMGGMGMGMGMPGMGMGMGMPGMGMGMPGMGMGMPGMGGGMPGGSCKKKDKSDEVIVVCKTNRDQQCDESGMAPIGGAKGGKKK